MKPWREMAIPNSDIRSGKFDESVFAADLSDVIADRGPFEYRDAQTFFRKTYPTQGLLNLLSTVVSRLAGQGGGDSVIQIQTPFGGGKTHSLIALYHLFRNANQLESSEAVSKVLQQAGVYSAPQTGVFAFVGTAPDPLKDKTPWGALADQLGNYSLLRDQDERRRAPGKDLLHQLLAGKPTLILMDELAEYAVKAKDFGDQIMAFLQELTEAVKVLPQCALVVTLPSSAPYGEEGERALQQLQRIFGRVEAVYTPVEGEEVYEIIRRRLFEDAPNPRETQEVAENLWQMYQHLGEDVPREVREASYRDKLRKAYPFHPEVIDILYERWATFSNFQRTRGVLRLLAEVVADLYKKEHSAPLIQPAHLDLRVPAIRREFLKHIGNEYEGVIASDIADGNAKAQKIDREMGSEYARFAVASGLATSIFFDSFSGSERRGVGIQRLRVAVLREGIPPALVADALRRLEDELWFLHSENGIYSFSSQPNLNRVQVEKEEAVSDEQITEEIRTLLQKLAGTEMRVTLLPKVPQDLPDTRDLKLAILSSAHSRQSPATDSFVRELLEKHGTTFRNYKNTLLALAPGSAEFADLHRQMKQLLALRAVRDDKGLMRSLSEENRKTLESKLKNLEGDLPFRTFSAYRHLAKLADSDVQWMDLGLPTVGEKGSLSKRVREYLKSKELLLAKISARLLLQKALREDENEKPLGEVVDAFLKYPHLPMLEGDQVVKEAVAQGVREGVFGAKIGERTYLSEPVPESELDYGVVIMRKEAAEQAKKEAAGVAPAPSTGGEPQKATREGPPAGPVAPPPTSGIGDFRIQAKVPWDKFSDFFRGVISPLRSEGAEVDIVVSVHARSDTRGIKRSTIDQKVKETLDQIGAEVLEESIE